MGDVTREQAAAAEMYADASAPADPRSEAQAGDSPEDLLRDAAAEKLRAAGCPASEALRYVAVVLGVVESTRLIALGEVEDEESGAAMFARPDAVEAVRVMAVKLVQAPKPRFSAGCLLLAAGIDYHGIRSARDWAAQQGVSPQLASEEVRHWQESMRLPRTSAQKSAAACAAYAATNGATKINL